MRITTCAVAILVLLLCPASYSQRKGSGSNPFRKFVKALPPVDKVEITAVTPLLSDEVKNVDCTRPGFVCAPDKFPYEIGPVKTLTGEDADKLAALWRKLERDYLHNEGGCLAPDHILRFYQGDQLLLETQVCTYCRKITLPKRGVVRVAGSIDASYYDFQDFLIPDSSREPKLQNFKREMMPKVGQQLTVIGLVGGGGKPSLAVGFGYNGIYIYDIKLSDQNYLYNLGCHAVIKVTGTLRYFEPEHQEGPVARQIPPAHFYFEKPEIEVIRVEKPPRSQRPKRQS